jgi:hypothetical protein
VPGNRQDVAELDEATVWAWWTRNAERQGLPAVIENPALISKLVTLALAGSEGGGDRAG